MADVENAIKDIEEIRDKLIPAIARMYGSGFSSVFACDKAEEKLNNAIELLKSQQAEIERMTKPEEEKQAERKRKRLEYNRKYRESHRDQAYQKLKEWRKNNPEKWKAQKAREREKQRLKRLKGGDGE